MAILRKHKSITYLWYCQQQESLLHYMKATCPSSTTAKTNVSNWNTTVLQQSQSVSLNCHVPHSFQDCLLRTFTFLLLFSVLLILFWNWFLEIRLLYILLSFILFSYILVRIIANMKFITRSEIRVHTNLVNQKLWFPSVNDRNSNHKVFQ